MLAQQCLGKVAVSADAPRNPRIQCYPETHMYVNSMLQREHVPVGMWLHICFSPGGLTVKPELCGISGDCLDDPLLITKTHVTHCAVYYIFMLEASIDTKSSVGNDFLIKDLIRKCAWKVYKKIVDGNNTILKSLISQNSSKYS